MNQHTSQYIIAALGGNRFSAMTGVYQFSTQGDNLVFQLPKKVKGINKVKIQYNKASDAFDVTFYDYQPRKYHLNTVKTVEGVHVGQLQQCFTQHTGLETSL